MAFQMLTQYNAKNFTPGPRKVTAITIHWWGDPVGQTFEGIIDWFCNPNSSVTTSAHYVAEAGRVACIVSPDDIAWHAGDWNANVANIGIECNPRATDADYQTIGELVAYLRGIYGDVPLYPHKHWTQTTCPGAYDVNRIDAIARGAKPQAAVAPQSSNTKPIQQEDDLTPEQAAQLAYIASPQFKADIFTGKSAVEVAAQNAYIDRILTRDFPWYGFDGKVPASGRKTTTVATDTGWADSRATGNTAVIGAKLDALMAVVAKGANVDVATLKQTVEDAVKASFGDYTVTIAKADSNG